MKSKTADITAKYQKMIDNIQWHLKTNKPTDKMELQKLYQQINDYREMIVDLETVASQFQHPVPDEAGEVYSRKQLEDAHIVGYTKGRLAEQDSDSIYQDAVNYATSIQPAITLPLPKEEEKVCMYYYPLFKFFSDEHSLSLLDSEIQEIIIAVEMFNISKLSPAPPSQPAGNAQGNDKDDFNEMKRLYDWLMDDNRKNANTFFTAGDLRNVAKEIQFRLSGIHPSNNSIELMAEALRLIIEKSEEDYASEPMTFDYIIGKAKAAITAPPSGEDAGKGWISVEDAKENAIEFHKWLETDGDCIQVSVWKRRNNYDSLYDYWKSKP